MQMVESLVLVGATADPPTRCAAHTIQLAIYDCMANWNDDIEIIKEASRTIRKEIVKRKLQLPIPPAYNETRWSSTYRMLAGLVKIRSSFKDALPNKHWDLAEEMTAALHHLQILTTKLQGVQYLFGDLIRDIMVCEFRLQQLPGDFAIQLLTTLQFRKSVLLDPENLSTQAALFLDPRYNNMKVPWFSQAQKASIITYLLQLHTKIESTKPDTPKDINKDIDESDIFLQMMPTAPESTRPEPYSVELAIQLQTFGQQARPAGTCNTQEYWRINAQQKPELAALASVVLAAPASQVAVERAFSALPNILTSKCTHLTNDRLENLLFVKLNESLIPRAAI